jgi:hypothetical protein
MTREYWKDMIDKWQASGKSMAEFCRDENLSYWTFRDWKGRFLKPAKVSENGLVKLNLMKEQKKSSTIEVLVGPSRILVPRHFDESHLIRIVKSLRAIA